MNENGWGFKDFILIFSIIFIVLLITVVIYKVSFKKDDVTKPIDPIEEEQSKDSYSEMEYKLKLAAERYQNDNYQGTLESKETWILSYNMLKKKGYLKKPLYDMDDSSSECGGYVVFNKNGSSINYVPYLKCKNYKTKGYDSSKV